MARSRLSHSARDTQSNTQSRWLTSEACVVDAGQAPALAFTHPMRHCYPVLESWIAGDLDPSSCRAHLVKDKSKGAGCSRASFLEKSARIGQAGIYKRTAGAERTEHSHGGGGMSSRHLLFCFLAQNGTPDPRLCLLNECDAPRSR